MELELADAVARAKGWELVDGKWWRVTGGPAPYLLERRFYRPDLHWSLCGQLIEEADITLERLADFLYRAKAHAAHSVSDRFLPRPEATGGTQIVAVCRAYVAWAARAEV